MKKLLYTAFIILTAAWVSADVIYEEEFASSAPAAPRPLTDAGWNACYGESAESFYPYPSSDYKYDSAPYIRANDNYVLDNLPGNGNREFRRSGTSAKFIYTDEIAAAGKEISSISKVTFNLQRQAPVQIAIQLDNQSDWFLSESALAPGGEVTFLISGSTWKQFSFVPGQIMQVGNSAELPAAGQVTGLGFYYRISDDGSAGTAGDFALDSVSVTARSESSDTSNLFADSMWVSIASGSFEMGAQPGDSVFVPHSEYTGPDWDEAPVHSVQITQNYQMTAQEISNAQYEQFDSAHSSFRNYPNVAAEDDDPVTMITWDEAVAFCKWLSKKTGKSCRLPTEAEWEYAAGQAEKYELQGMTNGVHEWCSDWWGIYPESHYTDPGGMTEGTVRVIRGQRVTNRMGSIPKDRQTTIGFRVVQGALPEEVSYRTNKRAPVFSNVRQTKKQWVAVSETDPAFTEGTEFFRKNAIPSDVPYWNRHHVPSLTWCDNGDMLVTAFTGPNDASDQFAILISRLRNGAEQWDAPACFFIAPDFNVGSAVLRRAPDGTLHHYNSLSIAEKCGEHSFLKQVSTDNGATWSDLKVAHERKTSPARLWAMIDPMTLKDGTWIQPSDAGGGNDCGTNLFESDDEGDSWTLRSRYQWNSDQYAKDGATAGWIAGIHASVVELNNGDLLAFGRRDNIDGHAPFSQSSDGGRTWTYRASPFPPVYSGQRPVIKRLNEGPLLLISYTDIVANYQDGTAHGIEISDGAGNPQTFYGLFAALSYDDGKTWQNIKAIPLKTDKAYTAERGGYISSVQTPDNMIHMVTSRYYYSFNLAWLKEPMPAK